jgi:PAB1-binding protein PBP1
MFKQNEIKYGVKSTFDESLKDYTTEINRDASDFK